MLRPLLAATALVAVSLPALAFGPQDYDVRAVAVDGVVGTLEVTVVPAGGRVTVAVTGPQARVDRVTVQPDGDRVVVEQDNSDRRSWRDSDRDLWVTVKITVPEGASLAVEDFIGEGRVGNLRGNLQVDDMTSGTLTVGDVRNAQLGVSGSGDITVGAVAGDLAVEIDGSGEVKTGPAAGSVSLEINGSGDIEVASVNGAVAAEVNGSGDIALRGGRADPLSVAISGSGDLTLDGTAGSQSINQSGSGKVTITGRR